MTAVLLVFSFLSQGQARLFSACPFVRPLIVYYETCEQDVLKTS